FAGVTRWCVGTRARGVTISGAQNLQGDTMKVEIYSDIVCPWCYIGERRFERALHAFGPAARDVEVVFRPYQLDPSAPMEPQPLRERLAMRFGQSAVGMLERV